MNKLVRNHNMWVCDCTACDLRFTRMTRTRVAQRIARINAREAEQLAERRAAERRYREEEETSERNVRYRTGVFEE